MRRLVLLALFSLLLTSSTYADYPGSPLSSAGGNAKKLQGRDLADTAPTDGQVVTWSSTNSRWEPATPPGAGGGEANTASNVGTGGVGVFDAKVGVDLQFRNINAGSSKISVTLDSGNKEVDLDIVEANLTASSESSRGTVELATSSETSTGTDNTRAVSPDGLAGSIFGTRHLGIAVVESDTDVAVGDGKTCIPIPAELNGFNVIDVLAAVNTKGTTGTTDVQLRRRRSGSDVDVLSTKVTIGDEFYANDEVVDTSNDDLQTGDCLYVDVDAVHSTAPKGLSVVVSVRKP